MVLVFEAFDLDDIFNGRWLPGANDIPVLDSCRPWSKVRSDTRFSVEVGKHSQSHLSDRLASVRLEALGEILSANAAPSPAVLSGNSVLHLASFDHTQD